MTSAAQQAPTAALASFEQQSHSACNAEAVAGVSQPEGSARARGVAAHQRGEYSLAQRLLSEAAAADPRDARVACDLAAAALAAGDATAALAAADAALTLRPEWSLAWTRRARALNALCRYADVLAAAPSMQAVGASAKEVDRARASLEGIFAQYVPLTDRTCRGSHAEKLAACAPHRPHGCLVTPCLRWPVKSVPRYCASYAAVRHTLLRVIRHCVSYVTARYTFLRVLHFIAL